MNKEENRIVPQLRFPEFEKDGDWEIKTLGKITKVVSVRNKNNKKLPVYSISNKDGFVPQSEQFDGIDSTDRGYDISLYKVISKNTFAYNPARINIGSIGYSGELNDVIISSLYVCFKTIETIDDNFLWFFFQSNHFKQSVIDSVEGGIRNYLFYDNFSRIKFNNPRLKEQQKIANCLSSLDDLITTETEKLDLIQDHKKGLLQQLFPSEGETQPKFRFPEFKQDGDWEEMTLGVISSITTGRLDANAMVENGQYRFYTCARNYYFINDYEFDTEALLISGNGANVGYIHYYKGKFNAYQRTYVLDKFKKNVHYIKYFLELKLSKRIAEEKKEGNTPYIVKATLADMELLIPRNPKEQQKIAACLSAADDLIEAQSQKVEALQEHKKGLLQQLFPNVNELAV